jgi:hypothetical protein
MAREGTRSATGTYSSQSSINVTAVAPTQRVTLLDSAESYIGNSRPRVFPTVPEPTAPATKKRATANTGAKRGPKKATSTKASKPVGVTKKKAPAKKAGTATKVSYFCRSSGTLS